VPLPVQGCLLSHARPSPADRQAAPGWR
jgi:hypothetical protein